MTKPRRGERSPSSDVLMLVLCRPSGALISLSRLFPGLTPWANVLSPPPAAPHLSTTAYCLLPFFQGQVLGRAFGDAEAGGDELGGVGRLERGLLRALRERVGRGQALALVQLDYLLADE